MCLGSIERRRCLEVCQVEPQGLEYDDMVRSPYCFLLRLDLPSQQESSLPRLAYTFPHIQLPKRCQQRKASGRA
jgi:hypothetical protein